MGWLIFIVTAIIVIFLLVKAVGYEKEKTNEKSISLKRKLSEIEDFIVTRQIVGFGDRYVFAVDENNEKILLITRKYQRVEEYTKDIVSFSDIIGIELIANGKTTVSKRSTTRTIGGAIVGGVLAGGAGAIIGGLSGNTKQEENVAVYTVKILLRSIEKTSLIWYADKENANNIKDLVSVIIDKTDKSTEGIPEETFAKPSDSIADELLKMNELKEKGIITEAEFTIQKDKLLSK
jgi:hypothetical protein